MKNKLKIFSLVAVILAIMISFTSSCFAVDTDTKYVEHNGNQVNISGAEGHPCFLLYSKSKDKYYYFGMWVGDDTKVDGSKYWCSEDDEYYVIGGSYNGSPFSSYCLFEYDIETGATTTEATGLVTVKYGSAKEVWLGFKKDDFVSVYKTTDVYTDKTYTELSNSSFFQQPPVGVLAPIVEEVPLEETIKEIVGILPIVLITLVGLIGLRKGLALLSQTLHKA